ncbi:MAG: amidotransferase [Spirochaetes bacterium]|nr:amidotransferase [Spirochaetota bacterium]
MRSHYLQHVPFEGLGSMEAWLKSAGYSVTCTRLYANDSLPESGSIDFLIIMGGPMSVNDENEYPWLVREKIFIREFIESGKSVLGVCLGAQLIASAMGCRVYRNSEKEIGWFPVRGLPQPGDQIFNFPESAVVFHWHGETFDLPSGAVLLASSEACVNQAFQLCKSVIGLQFHLETTPQSALKMIENCGDELQPSSYIQLEAAILTVPPRYFEAINNLMGEVLSFLTPDIRFNA